MRRLSLPIVGALLGHTKAETTQRYAHLATDPLQEATNMIGDKIFKAMSTEKGRILSFPNRKS